MAVAISMTRGDTFTFNLAVTQSGAAYNLTGASIRMTAKWNYTDADNAAVFSRTIGSGITVTNAAGGLATVSIAPSNTSSLPATTTNLYYDIQVTDSGANIYTVAYGVLTVNPDVSITTP